MTYHTQVEISEAWTQMEHGTTEEGSRVVTDERLAQALRVPLAVRYRDHYSSGMSAGYTRQRGSEEAPWGYWRETL